MSSGIAAAKTLVDDVEKKSQTNEDHEDEKLGLYIVDTSQGDEALQLVGAERKDRFSEEYNLKLRRKLVPLSLKWPVLRSNR
jgi:MFS transporter, ACS family, allantoate permease